MGKSESRKKCLSHDHHMTTQPFLLSLFTGAEVGLLALFDFRENVLDILDFQFVSVKFKKKQRAFLHANCLCKPSWK